MENKICLITGGNSGIGKATAIGLAKTGATVVIVCRREEVAIKTVEQIKSQTSNRNVDFILADLSSQNSIRSLVKEFKSRYKSLNILVNVAGLISSERKLTVDNIEYTFALNHLSYFLLTNLLLDTLKSSAPSRVINVSADILARAKIDFTDLMKQKNYNSIDAYLQAKLGNVLFTYELARRLVGTGVVVNAMHPGIVKTNLGKDTTKGFLNFLIKSIGPLVAITPEKAAQTALFLALDESAGKISGQYWYKSKIKKTRAIEFDGEISKKLWQISEELTITQIY